MDQVLPIQTSAAGLLEPDSEELQLRVGSFRKLGYSSEEVRSALRKLGLSTDTNSVLGELVRIRTSAAPCSSDGEERRGGLKDPLLPPSWALGPRITTHLGHQKNSETELRPIVIDGSNVAMSHGNKEVFSCRGIRLGVNVFQERGHTAITVFVPTWRREPPRPDAPITDQHILMELERSKIVVFTPSRRVGGKRVVCYDDRFIVKLAHESDGVIVSNDTYRDLQGERPEWKKCIEERLLMFSFVNDKFMPPDDPLGRHGPSLDNLLRKKPLPTETKRLLCPYDKKCTYGIKCKFYHPERVNQSYLSLADELREKAQISTAKEEKTVPVSQRQPETGSAHDAGSHSPDSHRISYPSLTTENKLLYWEDPMKSFSHLPHSDHSQTDWPGLHSAPSHYYASVSGEYLDSGLGSFDGQYSDDLRGLSSSLRIRSQQQSGLAGTRHTSGPSRRCCSQPGPSAAHPQHHRSLDSHYQLSYARPSPLHYGGAPHQQHSYWSDPFQGLPQATESCSLPSSVQSSSYKGPEYHSWCQQQPPLPPAAFDPQRMELRQKLHSIFNPYQVDVVMEMFPHLMNAEKLAAEILKMKSQGGIF